MDNLILLGDCTKRLSELESESIDLVLTDPPYNTGIRQHATRLHNFFEDALSPDEYRDLAATVSQELYRVLKADRAAYMFINWRSLGVWLDRLAGAGFRLKNCIVWDKLLHGLNYQNYAHRHEFLIFAVKGRFFPKNGGDGDGFSDLWRIRRTTVQERAAVPHHETVKPEAVVRRPIEHASSPGDLVLDPFAGTGTTCAVAKALGRRYIGIEKNPDYYRICLRRLSDLQLAEAAV